MIIVHVQSRALIDSLFISGVSVLTVSCFSTLMLYCFCSLDRAFPSVLWLVWLNRYARLFLPQ
ncbi:hypothetical protein BDW75DRAFT_133729 [Aspergillus navahoensis]